MNLCVKLGRDRVLPAVLLATESASAHFVLIPTTTALLQLIVTGSLAHRQVDQQYLGEVGYSCAYRLDDD